MASSTAVGAHGPDIERWTLIGTILASGMAFMATTALNVAIPSIQASLNASGSQMIWVVSAYNLFLASLIMVGGSLGDHLGRKRVFMTGIVLFTVALIAAGLSPSVEFLIAASAIQGIGGALMVPGSLAIISAIFPNSTRGRAIGTWSTFTAPITIFAPVIGGLLASAGLWRGVFFINVPVALMALSAISHVPETRDESAPKALDYPGATLATLGLAGITYGFVEGPGRGFTDPLILFALIGGVSAMIAFVWVEQHSDHPMISLDLFRSRTFTGTNLLTLFLYGALGALGFFLSLNLVQVQGYAPNEAGYALAPLSILLFLMSRWSGGLADRIGPRPLLVIGPALAGVGFLLFGLNGMTGGFSNYWTTYFPAALAFGIGMGLTVAPLTATVMGSAPQEKVGMASGINNAVARAAGTLAVAIFGALALVTFSDGLSDHTSALNLPAAAQAQLIEEQAPNLAAAVPPETLAPEQQEAVRTAVKESYIDTFRLIMFVCTGLAWLSALCALLQVENPQK
jgi:EmrB/QacA subfamily drug resistance transporter